MKLTLVALYLVGLAVLFLLAGLRAMRSGRAWAPLLSSGLAAGVQISRRTRPKLYWVLTSAYLSVGSGAAAVLVHVVLSDART